MKTYLESEETKLLELSATNPRDCLLIRLLSRLGCRVSEALALSVEDVDFKGCTITIQHLKTRLKLACPHCNAKLAASHVYCPGCGLEVEEAVAQSKEYRRLRTLPIDNDTIEMIRDYVNRGGLVLRNEKQLLFGINRHRAWQIVRQCAQRTGLEDLLNPETGRTRGVSPHRLRDVFAVHAMKTDDSGDGLRLLQEHLGHTSFNTTARYRKVAGDEHRKWYEQLWRKDVQDKLKGGKE